MPEKCKRNVKIFCGSLSPNGSITSPRICGSKPEADAAWRRPWRHAFEVITQFLSWPVGDGQANCIPLLEPIEMRGAHCNRSHFLPGFGVSYASDTRSSGLSNANSAVFWPLLAMSPIFIIVFGSVLPLMRHTGS